MTLVIKGTLLYESEVAEVLTTYFANLEFINAKLSGTENDFSNLISNLN